MLHIFRGHRVYPGHDPDLSVARRFVQVTFNLSVLSAGICRSFGG